MLHWQLYSFDFKMPFHYLPLVLLTGQPSSFNVSLLKMTYPFFLSGCFLDFLFLRSLIFFIRWKILNHCFFKYSEASFFLTSSLRTLKEKKKTRPYHCVPHISFTLHIFHPFLSLCSSIWVCASIVFHFTSPVFHLVQGIFNKTY